MKRIALSQFLVAALAFACVHAIAQTSPPIAGVVVGIQGHTLRVKSSAGQVAEVKLADDVHVSLFTPESLDDVKPGSFVGATAKPDANGTLVASEVHIFPDALRGMGEGHYPMKSQPGNTMTNATVSGVTNVSKPASSMTNANVASVAPSASGRLLHLTYKGGQQDILVPTDTPVVLYERGSLASLVPGVHVRLRTTSGADGTLTASRVSVGKNGSVPPL